MTQTSLRAGFWHKKISFSYFILLVLITALIFGLGQYFILKVHASELRTIAEPATCPPPELIRFRMNNYQFAHPLLLVDVPEESKNLDDLKSELELLIQSKKAAGEITSASVYIRKFTSGEWISINDNETYNPGSLLKVPTMMTFLKRSEKEPGFLDKEIYFNPAWSKYVPSQTFTEKQIEPGKRYKIRDLIYAMIVKSDNNATMLLHHEFNIEEFKKLFTSIGLTEPDVRNSKYEITASGFSKFMRMLYNATYITSENADYALSLLSQGSFKEGMLKELPEGIKVSHKFGEFGEPEPGSLKQLHESGIIFFEGNPVLLTIMTKGNDVKKLPDVIKEIAKPVFNRMSQHPNS